MRYPDIEAERARHNMTQRALSGALCVSAKTYQNWQNGESDIPVSKLCRMADLFGCTTDYLLGRNPGNHDKDTA